MFEWTKWSFEEPDIRDSEKFDMIVPAIVKSISDNLLETQVGIIRQFPFSSSLQRMAVITKTLGEADFVLFCKGSPEKILSLCDSSTGNLSTK
jgi:cation-transporting ATPase 13A2